MFLEFKRGSKSLIPQMPSHHRVPTLRSRSGKSSNKTKKQREKQNALPADASSPQRATQDGIAGQDINVPAPTNSTTLGAATVNSTISTQSSSQRFCPLKIILRTVISIGVSISSILICLYVSKGEEVLQLSSIAVLSLTNLFSVVMPALTKSRMGVLSPKRRETFYTLIFCIITVSAIACVFWGLKLLKWAFLCYYIAIALGILATVELQADDLKMLGGSIDGI